MNILFFNENDILSDFSLPADHEVHVWIFPLEKHALLAEDMKVLPDFELERAASFRFEDDRLRYLVSRSLLRRILSVYLHRPAPSFTFEKGKHGKPYLADESIHFNFSHAGEYIALAFCTGSPVGIDIEKVRPGIRMDSLVRRFFHADEAKVFSRLNAQEKSDFLFRRWTIREAFLKGLGCGLTMNTDSFLVEACPEEGAGIFRITKSQKDFSLWRIACIPAPRGYYCSAAYIPV